MIWYKEVGRLYYFLEADKKPLLITEQPIAKYSQNSQEIDYKGDGNWIWKSFHDDGSTARVIHLKANQMDGKAVGFHESGLHSFIAHYKSGNLHGELCQFSNDGRHTKKALFKNGEKVKDLAVD